MVVLLTITPSTPLAFTTSATSSNSVLSRSGAIFNTILGFAHFHPSFRSASPFRVLITSASNSSSIPRFCNPLSPGVLGEETFTTRTSDSGPNVRTPLIKSEISSGGEDLFLPRLTARMRSGAEDGGYLARYERRWDSTMWAPRDGKP